MVENGEPPGSSAGDAENEPVQADGPMAFPQDLFGAGGVLSETEHDELLLMGDIWGEVSASASDAGPSFGGDTLFEEGRSTSQEDEASALDEPSAPPTQPGPHRPTLAPAPVAAGRPGPDRRRVVLNRRTVAVASTVVVVVALCLAVAARRPEGGGARSQVAAVAVQPIPTMPSSTVPPVPPSSVTTPATAAEPAPVAVEAPAPVAPAPSPVPGTTPAPTTATASPVRSVSPGTTVARAASAPEPARATIEPEPAPTEPPVDEEPAITLAPPVTEEPTIPPTAPRRPRDRDSDITVPTTTQSATTTVPDGAED